MGNTLIAYQKWEDMAEYILKCVVNQLPKSERYALGEQIRRLTVGIGVHIARAVAIRHVGMRKKEVEEEYPNEFALRQTARQIVRHGWRAEVEAMLEQIGGGSDDS